MFRLEAELQQLQTQAAALRSRHGSFQGSTSRGTGQVEMLTNLQNLLATKLNLQKDVSRQEAERSAPERLLSSTVSGLSRNRRGSSETNVMTL